MLVVMVVIGGSGSLVGAILAAMAIMVLREVLRPVEQAVSAYGLVQIVTAILLIGTLLLRPQGFFGSSEPRFLRPCLPTSSLKGRETPTDGTARP
jgi:branched-chain amino acid transport system permease protein